MQSTKDKIIQRATILFNNQSFGAVSLFEIARSLGISRGNLTYHFKDKDQLLLAIAQQMWEKLAHERQKSLQVPSFKNIHNEVQLFYKYQQQYAFIFMDHLVLGHPLIRDRFREMTANSIDDMKNIIAFSIQVGNMKKEPFPGIYNHLATMTWMLTFYWLPQQIIRGEQKKDEGEKLIWSLLLPHLTKKGVAHFNKYFGQDYIDSLGDPFSANLAKMIQI